jgi:hypothetical protein
MIILFDNLNIKIYFQSYLKNLINYYSRLPDLLVIQFLLILFIIKIKNHLNINYFYFLFK